LFKQNNPIFNGFPDIKPHHTLKEQKKKLVNPGSVNWGKDKVETAIRSNLLEKRRKLANLTNNLISV